MQSKSNPANNSKRSLPMPCKYPILHSISKDGHPMFSTLPTTR